MQHERGFTVIEVLTTIFIASIVMLALYTIYTTVDRVSSDTYQRQLASQAAYQELQRFENMQWYDGNPDEDDLESIADNNTDISLVQAVDSPQNNFTTSVQTNYPVLRNPRGTVTYARFTNTWALIKINVRLQHSCTAPNVDNCTKEVAYSTYIQENGVGR